MVNLTFTIEGVDRTNRVQANSLSIDNSINNRRDTCTFVIRKNTNQTYYPQRNEEVIITDDSEIIFGGVIISTVQKAIIGQWVEYEVTCSDFTYDLDSRLVLERFNNTSIYDIIEYLRDTYAPDFTIDNVLGSFVIKSIAFNRITMSDCLDKIASALNYFWYVDYEKDIHFFPKNNEIAPFNLSDTSENYVWNSLQITQDISQLRNAVFIEGGEAEGNARTEEFTAPAEDVERTTYRLANKFASKPVVTVNSVAQTVGIDFLNSDADYDCMWDYNQKYIRFTAGNIPPTSDIVEITGSPLYPVIIRVQSTTSIENYGIKEFVIRDKSIRSKEEARERALSELEAYQNGVIEASFKTYTKGLKAGQVININSSIRGVDESFIIQSVKLTSRGNNTVEWNISLATLRTVGIISFLQDLLKTDEVRENESETLLSFYDFEDTVQATDEIISITATVPPYIWLSDNPLDDISTITASGGKPPIRWNSFTWVV